MTKQGVQPIKFKKPLKFLQASTDDLCLLQISAEEIRCVFDDI